MMTKMLDFARLEADGVSQEEVLNFIQTQKNNFNYAPLKKYYEDNGLDAEQVERALYNDLKNSKVSFEFEPPQTPEQTPAKLPQNGIKPTNTPRQDVKAKLELPSAPVKEMSLEDLNARAQALEKEANWTDDLIYVGTLGLYETQGAKKQRLGYEALILDALKSKVPYAKLPKQAQEYLAKKGFENIGILSNPLKNAAQEEYNKEKMRQDILKIKDAKDLSEEQKHLIYKDTSLGKYIWNALSKEDNDALREYQEDIKGRGLVADVSKAMTFLNNIAAHKNIKELFSSSDPKVKEKYRQEAQTLAKGFGFEKAVFDEKGEMFVAKEGQLYKVNDNFFDQFPNLLKANAFSMAGSIAGGVLAGKKGGIAGMIAGGALGAFGGGGLDALLTNFVLERENNFQENLAHMLQEGALNVVGDVAGILLGKTIKGVANNAHKIAHKVSDIAEYVPFVGMGMRALNGNVKAAQEVLAEVYTPEQERSLVHIGEPTRLGMNSCAVLGC